MSIIIVMRHARIVITSDSIASHWVNHIQNVLIKWFMYQKFIAAKSNKKK